MRLVIESTGFITEIDGVPARLWRGMTPGGRPVDVYIHRIGTPDPGAQAELGRELREQAEPAELRAIPLSMILSEAVPPAPSPGSSPADPTAGPAAGGDDGGRADGR